MKKEEVITIIGEDNWDKFMNWMAGQTIGITKEGKIDYYSWDVEKFKRYNERR